MRKPAYIAGFLIHPRAAAGGAITLALGIGLACASPAGAFVWFNTSSGVDSAQNDGSNVHVGCLAQFTFEAGGYFYYLGDGGGIARSSADCSQTDDSLVPPANGNIQTLGSGGGYIFWDDDLGIGRANLDGSNAQSGLVVPLPSGTIPNAITADGRYIYWSTYQGIGRSNLDGSGPVQNWISTPQAVGQLYSNGQYLYFSQAGAIGRVPIDGSGPPTSLISNSGIAAYSSITSDGTYLYWTEPLAGNGAIGRAGLDGSSPNPAFMTPADGVTGPLGIDSGAAHPTAMSLTCTPVVDETFIVDSAIWAPVSRPTCTVTIRDTGTPTRPPTGTVVVDYPGEGSDGVSFTSDSCKLANAASGAVTCTVSEPLAGNYVDVASFGQHTVDASFQGDTFHLPSSAAPVTTWVKKAPPKRFNVPAKVGRPLATGKTLTVGATCPTTTWNSCVLTLTVSYTSHGKRIVLGVAHLTLSPGASATRRVSLRGKHHLPRHRTIKLKLVVSQPDGHGHLKAIATKIVTVHTG